MAPKVSRARRTNTSAEPTPDRERPGAGEDPNALLGIEPEDRIIEEIEDKEDEDERPTPPLPTLLPLRRTAAEVLVELQDAVLDDLDNEQLRAHLERMELL